MSTGYNGTSEFSTIAGRVITRLEGAGQWTVTHGLYVHTALLSGVIHSVSNGGGSPIVWELQMGPTGAVSAVWDNGGVGVGTTGAILSLDTGYHIAYVFNGGGSTNDEKVQIYLNGVNQGPLAFTGTAPPTNVATGSDNVCYVGVRSGGGFGYNSIYVDDIRMWEAALTPTEIVNDAMASIPCRPEMLRCWIPFTGSTDVRNFCTTQGDVTHNTATGDGGTLWPRTVHQAPSSINHHPSRRWRTRRSFLNQNVKSYPLMHRGM